MNIEIIEALILNLNQVSVNHHKSEYRHRKYRTSKTYRTQKSQIQHQTSTTFITWWNTGTAGSTNVLYMCKVVFAVS